MSDGEKIGTPAEHERDRQALRALAKRHGVGWIAGELATLCEQAQDDPAITDNVRGRWKLLAYSFRYLAERKEGPIVVSRR